MAPPQQDVPVTSSESLVSFFSTAAKPRSAFRVGIEHEKIPVRDDGSPPPYEGPDGIEALIDRLQRRGLLAEKEGAATIALEGPDHRVTFEPGGQVELSGPALLSAAASREPLLRHVRDVLEEGRALGIRFVYGGFRPFGSLDDVPWLPKRRYAVMRSYLPTRGRLAQEMMKRTATVQANFDFSDEADAVERIRVGMGASSIVTALFASSPISDGHPNGYKTYRAAVWLETDEARCGLLPFVFEPDFSFARYARWALDVPMFFVLRNDQYHPVDGMTFRQFLGQGWCEERATMSDWELHLSTLFPEVRLKRTIEVRGADAGPLDFVQGLAALWRGLLDDSTAREAAWKLVGKWPIAERERLRHDVPRAGLQAEIGGRRLSELAVELCAIAHDGLGRLPDGIADQALLTPLADYAARGRCPADDMLDDWHRLSGDPRRLVDAWDLAAQVG